MIARDQVEGFDSLAAGALVPPVPAVAVALVPGLEVDEALLAELAELALLLDALLLDEALLGSLRVPVVP